MQPPLSGQRLHFWISSTAGAGSVMRKPDEQLKVQRDGDGYPLAALALYDEQVALGLRKSKKIEDDPIGVAAGWERLMSQWVVEPPSPKLQPGPRVGRAYLTGTSPTTAYFRRRRDRRYLEIVANEATRTLGPEFGAAYAALADEWADRHKARRGFRWPFKL